MSYHYWFSFHKCFCTKMWKRWTSENMSHFYAYFQVMVANEWELQQNSPKLLQTRKPKKKKKGNIKCQAFCETYCSSFPFFSLLLLFASLKLLFKLLNYSHTVHGDQSLMSMLAFIKVIHCFCTSTGSYKKRR